jgi:hypothetical protein
MYCLRNLFVHASFVLRKTAWSSPQEYFCLLINLIIGLNLIQIGFVCRLVSSKDRFLVISRKTISAEMVILECIFVVLPALLFFNRDTIGFILIGFSLAVLGFYNYEKKAIIPNLSFPFNFSAVLTIFTGIVFLLYPFLPLFRLIVPEELLLGSYWLVVVGIMLLLCANFLFLFFSTKRLHDIISLTVAILGFCSIGYSIGWTRHFADTMDVFSHMKMNARREPPVMRDVDHIEKNLLLNLRFYPHSPYSAYAWRALGDIYELKGNKEKALEFYRKAFLELDRYERLFSSYGKRDIVKKVKALEDSLNTK